MNSIFKMFIRGAKGKLIEDPKEKISYILIVLKNGREIHLRDGKEEEVKGVYNELVNTWKRKKYLDLANTSIRCEDISSIGYPNLMNEEEYADKHWSKYQ